MTRIVLAAALALAVTLPAVQANASPGAIRTFVSTAGSDSNPCSLAQPCRHFSAAVAVTSAGGEVDALDPGAYGSFTISQAITIEGQGWSYVAPPSGGAAITINAVSGNVVLRGISLDGVGAGNASGIVFNSGGNLTVRGSVIQNFSNDGIDFVSNSSTLSQFFVSNTIISDNGGVGMFVEPFLQGTFTGVLDHVTMENNATAGLSATSASGGQTYNITVTDSVSANNGVGISSAVTSGGTSTMFVRNCTIANNTGVGLQASGTTATILVSRSTITGNGAGWAVFSSGVMKSYADNNIDGNTTVNTQPPTPLVYH